MGDWNSLIADAPNWANNDSEEYLAELPGLIPLAEERCYHEIEHYAFDLAVPVVLTANSPYVLIPAGYVQMRHFRLVMPDGTTPALDEKTPGWLYTAWKTPTVSDPTRRPRWWSPYDATRFRIAPTPYAGLAGEALFRRMLPALGPMNLSNALTQNCYRALLNAVLVESYDFLQSDDQDAQSKRFEARYQQSVAYHNNIYKRQKRDDSRAINVEQQNTGAPPAPGVGA